MADDPENSLSDGLLLLRGDPRYRSRLEALDDRDDVYLLCEVGDPSAAPAAHAVVRRTGDHAVLSRLTGPPDLFGRLIHEICDALRADGATTLSVDAAVPDSAVDGIDLAHPIPL